MYYEFFLKHILHMNQFSTQPEVESIFSEASQRRKHDKMRGSTFLKVRLEKGWMWNKTKKKKTHSKKSAKEEETKITIRIKELLRKKYIF